MFVRLLFDKTTPVFSISTFKTLVIDNETRFSVGVTVKVCARLSRIKTSFPPLTVAFSKFTSSWLSVCALLKINLM